MSDFRKTNSKAEHRRIREMLSVYMDGELPFRDQTRVEEHLADCDDCTWELETLRQTVELVGQLPKVPVPRVFTIYETPRPRPFGLFQARWVYTYLKGATALAAALLILVLAGDALFQFQGITTSFAPAKEFAAPAAAPTVVARQEVPPVSMEAPISPEEVLEEAEGDAYAEVMPSPSPGEETKALAPMPTPTVPAGVGGGPVPRAGATASPEPTPAAPLVDKADATGTPPPAAAMEVPADEGAPEAPAAPAAVPMTTPQPQMTATPIPAASSAPVSVTPSPTPTPLATATATATVTPAPTATPVSMARAPAEVRPTKEKGALAGQPARPRGPRLTLLRVVEASLCLLVVVLIAATLIVRRRSAPDR